ncbi:hypothetical protein CDAR_252251 [Caerostris darwini]|uniref:Uncharacterized protein n=1 Tax=Caerostris darwini TaxID=1538125 RepID=A0AAV4QDK0_9ARAC|nr:hypothetical protein CDAR_252251 [Caerostris darwini]
MVAFNVEWNVSYNDWEGMPCIKVSFTLHTKGPAITRRTVARMRRQFRVGIQESQTLHDRPQDTGMAKKPTKETNKNNKRKPAYRGVWQKRKRGVLEFATFATIFLLPTSFSLSLLKTSLLAYNETRRNCDLWTYVNPWKFATSNVMNTRLDRRLLHLTMVVQSQKQEGERIPLSTSPSDNLHDNKDTRLGSSEEAASFFSALITE